MVHGPTEQSTEKNNFNRAMETNRHYTYWEAGTPRNRTKLPSLARIGGVAPDPRFSVRVSTIVVVALTFHPVPMRRLKRPLLTSSARDGDTCVALVVCTKRRLSKPALGDILAANLV